MKASNGRKKGPLIVIEGVDASGKATQSRLLFEKVQKLGKTVKKIEFPDYDSHSSCLIKMYLSGDFGSDARDVNAYAASVFYAADRFASYKMKWERFYLEGGIVIADRYVSSNMIYQAAKFADPDERAQYLDWLDDLEHGKMGLPRPSMVLFLDLDPVLCKSLSDGRSNKFTGNAQKDIHESDEGYMALTYQVSMEVARKYDWQIIRCASGHQILTIEEISKRIFEKAKEVI